ncbi:AI-2E family transporter [Tissierella sp.]|uniref:AI-2E family transporter n=1 Tax=Tissierella sp. TaxID=41274 RepID=UPI00286491F7|nr:AI-2E family transporter [Tissierella sp.]MDR7855485.1 AI-2E family transporter [Tissierella sp.]
MKNAILLITFAIVLMWLLDNIVGIWGIISGFLAIITPFIIGGAIAFILNNPMNYIEKKLFKSNSPLRKTKESFRRPLSYLVTLLVFLATIFIVLFIIVPELARTTKDLAVKLPTYWKTMEMFITENLSDNPWIMDWINSISFDWNTIQSNIFAFLKNSVFLWLGSTFSIASSVVSGIVTFAVGFVFSIYLLLQKESLTRQWKKVILALFPKKAADRIFYIGRLSNTTFANFLSGQLLEAIIIGVLFFVAMVIFKFPYALMISTVIAVTALVPIFGSFVGCFIGVFLIVVESPKMALLFIIMFLVIQQIEGNLIYPHVVGKASGLPSIWILVAVTVGGSLMGVLGILLFIPLFSVLYTIASEYINNRLKEKGIKRIK